jgi:hypothetical protein
VNPHALHPAILAELVAATRMGARGLVDEVDPYMLAATICVGHRLTHPETYGWDRMARAYPVEAAISAAKEAEKLDKADGVSLADWLGEDEVAA